MRDQALGDDPEDGMLDDLERVERQPLTNVDTTPQTTRSHYALTRKEITKGIANRFVHSRAYILLYLCMTALSVTTIILSLGKGCPGLAFYILEIIINSAMILEVGIRFVAFGKQFWKSPFNVVDLILTLFCAITLLAITLVGCGAGSKAEEVFDTLLLIARNVLQFGRLASVMRQSGQSIFTGPKPIDLSSATRSRRLDIDIDDDDDLTDDEGYGPLPTEQGFTDAEDGLAFGMRNQVVFDAETPTANQHEQQDPWRERTERRDVEDTWATSG